MATRPPLSYIFLLPVAMIQFHMTQTLVVIQKSLSSWAPAPDLRSALLSCFESHS